MSDAPSPPGWDLEQSPFHEGELAIQERVGVRDKMDAIGRRVVRRYLTEQHRGFFPLLPYVFIGSVDTQGRPWASVLFGEPGFIDPLGRTEVRVRARPLHGDPLGGALAQGVEIAMLGVQLHTRRRNRVFGTISTFDPDGFTIAVRQTLGICPQYIQGREPEFTRDPMEACARPVHLADRLDTTAQAIIARADTYFVASVDPREADGPSHGADVSHRGGRPGFVRVDDDKTLTAPEFVGNFIFNTLGNWQIDDRAGLLFIDFAHGDLLYVAARAEIIWEGPELRAFTGAQRLVRYHVEEVIRVEGSLPARFTPPMDSPMLERTGTWAEVARTLEAERDRNEWRRFRIARMERESADIRSFHLEPTEERGLVGHEAGQFLPIRVKPAGWEESAVRTYTISSAPGSPTYRISVKREGKRGVSDWLHGQAEVGTIVEALGPRGTFTFETDPCRAAVLISVGVGITPFLAMLDELLVNDDRTRHHAPIWFVHGARNSASHAFAGYLRKRATRHDNLHAHVRYSQPHAEDALGRTHDSVGTVDVELLKSILPFDDYDFYLCGPAPFMQRLYDDLMRLGVRDDRIRFEAFGPAQVARIAPHPETGVDSGEAIAVTFAKSGKASRWWPDRGSLLDLAEQAGVAPLSSCRSGICGTCATRVLHGDVDYTQPPAHDMEANEALICIARPCAGPHLEGSMDREGITLDL